jgi:HEAT repeat protein
MPSALATSALPVVLPDSVGGPPVPDILEEHLEELGYLCLQRRKQIFSTEIPVRRLPALDERIAAHWDALVLGGGKSAEVALNRFEDNNPWIAAAAARVWLELGQPDRAQLMEKLAEIPETAWGIWREAFRRLSPARLQAIAPLAEVSKAPMPLRMLLDDAYAWNVGLPPEVAVAEARGGPPGVRVVIARHLGTMPKDPTWGTLAGELVGDDMPAVARGALWSLAIIDRKQGLRVLRAHAAGSGVGLDPARLLLCGIFGEREDAAILRAVEGGAAVLAAATRALGELGCLESVDLLLERLSATEPDVAQAAAAALERILGSLNTLVPPAEAEAAEIPPPPDVPAVAAEVSERRSKLPSASAHLDGRGVPWTDAPREEPMAWVWRANVRGERDSFAWMKREIPDGVLDGEWATDARVGE